MPKNLKLRREFKRTSQMQEKKAGMKPYPGMPNSPNAGGGGLIGIIIILLILVVIWSLV